MEKDNKPKPVYEPVDYGTLNKFLLGTIAMVRRKEISTDEAVAIAKLSDKVIKNNLTMIMEKNRLKSKEPIEFFNIEKQLLIG